MIRALARTLLRPLLAVASWMTRPPDFEACRFAQVTDTEEEETL